MNLVEAQYGEDIYLSEYTEYDEGSFRDLCEDLINRMNEARANGLVNVFVQFRSTLEPYEAMSTGLVEVQIRGYRELDSREKAQQKEEKRIQALATKLGITFYEASVVDRLEKQKKVKL